MRTHRVFAGLTALSISLLLAACSNDAPRGERPLDTHTIATAESAAPLTAAPAAHLNPRLLRRFQPVKAAGFDAPVDPELISLGRQLFHEPRLSLDSSMSCNTCHDLQQHGVDHRTTSPGVNNKLGVRNSPTVFNAAGQFTQFWDGRSGTVETQATGPIVNPAEMAMPNGDQVVSRLQKIPGYVEQFTHVFHDPVKPVTLERVGIAIGAFERKLSTPGRWDSYLAGQESALTATEQEGLRTFLNIGCMVCHTGPLLGGATFEHVGVVEAWPNQGDIGRMAVTNNSADRMSFKVPSLRNVGETAPYFHDGSAATLEEAVKAMGRHQLGLDLSQTEIQSIAAWLRSLTGSAPEELLSPPELPR